MLDGWVSVHREIIDSKLWSCSDATFRVAMYLLLSANHKPKYHRRIIIERGQCIRSLTMISDDCNLSRKSVRHALKILSKDNFLAIDEPFGAQQGHRLTVCKYNQWQSKEKRKGTDGTNEGDHEGDHEGNTNNNVNNDNNEIKKEKEISGYKKINMGYGGNFYSPLFKESLKGEGNANDDGRSYVSGDTPSIFNSVHLDAGTPVYSARETHDDDSGKNKEMARKKAKKEGEKGESSTEGDPEGIGNNELGVDHDQLEKEKGNQAKPAPKTKPGKTKTKKNGKSNGIVLDLSAIDPVFDKAIIEEFIEFRKVTKKNPLTQRALDGVCRNTKKVKEKYGGTENGILIYAMEQKWLTPDTKYVDDNQGRYRAFLDDQSGGGENKDASEKEKLADLERRRIVAQREWDEKNRDVNA